MNRIEIAENGHSATFPSSWDEMSHKQIQSAFREFARCESPLEFNIRMLFLFLGIKPCNPRGHAAENVYRLCEKCLGFLLKDDGGVLRLAFDSVANPLPRVGCLYGPADMLQDLTFGEFRHAAMAVQAFSLSRDVDDLDECVGILYRSRCRTENRSGRRAGPLGTESWRRDRRRASKMAPWRKSLILQWFCSCLQHLQRGTIHLDGEDVDLSLLFRGGESDGPSCTWNDLLVQIAKDQTIGNIDRVDEEPLYSVLRIMWSNYKEAKRYEKTSKA